MTTRLAGEYNWTYETAGGLHSGSLVCINKGGGGDYTRALDSTNAFQAAVSWTRFNE